jgi:hypothetical protein
MAEQFGARPYSSELACITEVERSDVYLVILGERYGFTTGDGVSVTEAEFDAARACRKPILAFVMAGDMEERQAAFRAKVESYSTGLFRATFASPGELKDSVIKSLRNLERRLESTTEGDMLSRVTHALANLESHRRTNEPRLTVAFWPQPVRSCDVVALEKCLDERFEELASVELVSLRDGYEVVRGGSWTGLQSKQTTVTGFEDGLQVYRFAATAQASDWSFANYYVSPSYLNRLALAAQSVSSINSGWCYLELAHMEHAKVAEPPSQRTNSISLRTGGVDHAHVAELFVPITEASYGEWLKRVLGRFQRTFG